MALLFLYIAVALGFSFLCSVAEAVLLSVTPAYIAQLEREGRPVGGLLRRQKENVDRPLSAILTLNTIAHTVGAAGAGAQAVVVFGSRWVGVASVVLTLLILFLSEIIPKTIGAVHWRSLAPCVARSLVWLIRLLYPFVLTAEWTTRLVSRRKAAPPFRREEFSAMADLGAQSGELHQQESHILKNLMRFGSIRLVDVMTPRTVLFALPESQSVAEAMAGHSEIPFSRIPVFGRSIDDVTGFVLKSDLLLAGANGTGATPLRDIRREITALPEQARLRKALDHLLKQRQHIVLVLDEYGGTAGVATLEDIVETLLGLEIVDEGDQAVDMQELARQQWKKRAKRLGLVPQEKKGPPTSSEKEEDRKEYS